MSASHASAPTLGARPVRSNECTITTPGHVCTRRDGSPLYTPDDACFASARDGIARDQLRSLVATAEQQFGTPFMVGWLTKALCSAPPDVVAMEVRLLTARIAEQRSLA